MRTILAATALILAASSVPALAYDYPWCARTSSNGFNGDCSFTSYRQCLATVSGQLGECRINPRVAFRQDNRNRHPRHRNY